MIVGQENILILFVTDTYLCTYIYFLCKYFFISLCHQFYSHHQGFSNRDIFIGNINIYLVKTNLEKKWHVPYLAEELVNNQAKSKLVQVLHQTLAFFRDRVHDKSEISQHQLFLNCYKRVLMNLKMNHLKTKILKQFLYEKCS